MAEPKVGFRRDDGSCYPEWKEVRLGDVASRVTRKNTNNETDRPLTIASIEGLVDQRTYFGKTIASKDMSGYYLLKNGESRKRIEQYFIDREVEKAEAAERLKQDEEKKELQYAEAMKTHDVIQLISLNKNRKWGSKEQVIKSIEAHQRWSLDPSKGQQLSLFAEEIRDVDLRNVCFENATFSHCLFYGLNLEGVHFRDCNLSYSRFRKCKLKSTSFDGSDMEGVQFE